MTNYNGGWATFPDRTTQKKFFRATNRHTKSVTVKSGQVIKALSFLESDTDGKVIAHSGINEIATVTFPTKVDTTETVIIAGLTFTAGTNLTVTQAELVALWEDIPAGTTYTEANTLKADLVSAEVGEFTAGTLTGYESISSETAGSVDFRSTTPNTNVTDLTVTGTGDTSTVTVTAVNLPQKPIAGVLAFDVDASTGDVEATAFTEASFWADALVWGVDIETDTIELYDGTTKAVTAYNIGATTDRLKQKFVEGSGFTELGFLTAGEVL